MLRTHCCRHKCFPVCPRAQHLLRTQILCPGHKNVSDFVQKHFVSATNVSQFARARKRHEQQCVRNNVSSFASTLCPCLCLCLFFSCQSSLPGDIPIDRRELNLTGLTARLAPPQKYLWRLSITPEGRFKLKICFTGVLCRTVRSALYKI